MSIRLRLTLLYSAILAVTLTVFSIASYVTVARDGFNRLVSTLESKTQRIVANEQFQLGDIEALAHQFAGPEIYVQTRDAAGAVVDRTSNLGKRTLPLNPIDETNPGAGSAWVDIALIDGERRLIYNQPIVDSPASTLNENALFQISISLTDRDRSLSNLARVLVAGNLLVILAAFGTGWLLAGIGLRPIFRLAQAVLEIGRTRDFAQRVNYAGSDDEIGQLATTFDQMLTELEETHRQTEQALQTQKRFVADASHELRTPLTTIRGNLELLRREPPIRDDDRLAVLTDLIEESDRLIRMVNDLLVLARADVQPPEWQEPIRLQPLLDQVQRQIKQLAPERSVHFEPASSTQAETIATRTITVLGHEDALKQVLLILLDNALKHTPPTAQITVSTTVEDSQVEICVRDTGPGIPTDELSRIFDRFYVVDTARTQNSTGLGLAIAKTLIASQKGQITVASTLNDNKNSNVHSNVNSNPNSGTTFKVTLSCQK